MIKTRLNINTYSHLDDNERVVETFLRALQKEVATAQCKYCDEKYNLACMPYNTNERGMDAVVLPALAKLCGGLVMTEVPTIRKARKCKGEDAPNVHNGRIDYWCIYKGYTFVIELKHSFECDADDNKGICENSTRERWNTMIDQLKKISDVKDYEENTKSVIGLGIHYVSLYSSVRSKVSFTKTKVQDTFDRMEKAFARPIKPMFQSIWVVPKQMVESELEGGQGSPTHALLLMAYVKHYPQHIGSK